MNDETRRKPDSKDADAGETSGICRPSETSGRIFRFLLTGGPGAGKTESKKWLIPALESCGYKVLFVSESATELITSGISAMSIGDAPYQKRQLLLQLKKEKEAAIKAEEMAKDGQDVLIFFDRGTLDGIAWWNRKDFDKMLEGLSLSEEKLKTRYDAIFHLQSAACRSDEDYDRSTNAARIALPEEAREFDARLQKIYQDHPNWSLIVSRPEIKSKMDRLTKGVLDFIRSGSAADSVFSQTSN